MSGPLDTSSRGTRDQRLESFITPVGVALEDTAAPRVAGPRETERRSERQVECAWAPSLVSRTRALGEVSSGCTRWPILNREGAPRLGRERRGEHDGIAGEVVAPHARVADRGGQGLAIGGDGEATIW